MAIRKKQEPDEYQKALRKFHKKSNRHVVVFEADISEDEKRRIFSDADHLRQCGNELLGIMERNLEQLLRTKRYRALQKLYGKVSDPIHALEKKEVLSDEETQKLNHLKKERAEITNSMNQMRESYQVTWDICRTKMMELKEKYPLKYDDSQLSCPYIIEELDRITKGNAIITTDVGQHQMWATQYLELDSWHQLITSGGLGTMGFGFPAAIGAKIGNRDKEVVCFTGDGGFQMNIQEMATAVTQGTGITICLLNNNYLGMVRQMQELFYGKRYSATCLRRRPSCPGGCKGPNDQCPEYVPDFVKLAESYGAYGIRVEKEEDIDAAFAEAKKHTDAPTIIEFMIATDELVLPMVKSGNPMSEMILK